MTDSKPKVIDLFSGVGGLSLGAARAGFDVCLAVENDKRAIESHATNFPNAIHWEKDVSSIAGRDLLSKAGVNGVEGLIGGPPCQGFSTIGRRDQSDPRNMLYRRFYELVCEIRPDFFVAENVPGILTDTNRPILDSALSLIGDSYDIIGPSKVKASDLGAPTTRTRVFVIGIKKNKNKSRDLEGLGSPLGSKQVFVRDALLGLPEHVDCNWRDDGFDHWGTLTQRGDSGKFFSDLYGNIPEGIGDQCAIRRLSEANQVSGCVGTIHQPHVIERFARVLPGGKDAISKATRLNPDGFCPTLRAGTGSDRGSYQAVRPLHPVQPRVITPREAARLQGFPDWFQFNPTKWHSFRQIGNSVSPIVAEALLASIIKFI